MKRTDRLSLLMSNELDPGISQLDAVALKAEMSAVIYCTPHGACDFTVGGGTGIGQTDANPQCISAHFSFFRKGWHCHCLKAPINDWN